MREDVITQALKTKLPDGRDMHALASDVLEIASSGLIARKRLDSFGEDESHFLNALKTIVKAEKTPAEELLERYHGAWNEEVDPVFSEYAY